MKKALPFFVFYLGMVLFLPFVSNNIGWYNSGEFVAAALTEDVPHAPGYPLLTRLAALSLELPLNTGPAGKMNLLSAIIAILAAALLTDLLLKAGLSGWPAFSAGVLLLCSQTYFEQAILFEVYCLEVLFIIIGLRIGLRLAAGENSKGLAFFAGLIGALGVGHRPTFVLFAATLFFFIQERRNSLREMSWFWFAMGVFAGLLPSFDLYLRLQSTQRVLLDPMVGRGISGFLRVFTGTVYSGGLFSLGFGEVFSRFVFFIGFILRDSSILVLPAALLAIVLKDGNQAFKKALICIGMVNLIFVLNYNAFEAHSMLLPCILALSALAAHAFQAVRNERIRAAICILVIISAPMGAWLRFAPVESESTDYCQRFFRYIPADSVLLMSNDVEFRPYYYLRLLQKFRSDAVVQLVDNIEAPELYGLSRLIGQRTVAGSLVHPPDALDRLVASFSLEPLGYGYKVIEADRPFQNFVELREAQWFQYGAASLTVKLLADLSYRPGEVLEYGYGFCGPREEFTNMEVVALLLSKNSAPIARNGLAVAHDSHRSAAFINRQLLAEKDNLHLFIRRTLVLPYDLPPGEYFLKLFFVAGTSVSSGAPEYSALIGVNRFNFDGFLEVFKLKYGLTNRILLTRAEAAAVATRPAVFSTAVRVEAEPSQ